MSGPFSGRFIAVRHMGCVARRRVFAVVGEEEAQSDYAEKHRQRRRGCAGEGSAENDAGNVYVILLCRLLIRCTCHVILLLSGKYSFGIRVHDPRRKYFVGIHVRDVRVDREPGSCSYRLKTTIHLNIYLFKFHGI
jgi:hypothetical protein